MSLLGDAIKDSQSIFESPDSASIPILFISAPPAAIEYGTLDPEDVDNHILGWPGDHFTQVDPDQGNPQAGLNAKVTLNLKTLLNAGIIDNVAVMDFDDWQVSWLDVSSGLQRDFLVDKILPTRTLGQLVILLGELKITPEGD